MSGFVSALEDMGARQREQSEALARPARIRFFVKVNGSGESRLEGKNGIFFGAYMLEEPTVSWGVSAIGQLPPGTLPLATVCVIRYHKNQNFYTGCDLGIVVESGAPNTSFNFSLTFEGVTLRTTAPMSNAVKNVTAAAPTNK